MSSNEDMFDLSDVCDDMLFQTPETPTPPTPTPPTPTPPASSPTPPTPTPPPYNLPSQKMLLTGTEPEVIPSQSLDTFLNSDVKMAGVR